jgi:ABC-type polar amino acid transport system ATPase subunit
MLSMAVYFHRFVADSYAEEMSRITISQQRIIFMDEWALVEDRDPVGFFERPDNPRTKKFLSKILR